MKIILCCLILNVSIVLIDAIACTANICNTVKCRVMEPTECPERTVFSPKGGFCGCCPACIQLLQEGENCGVNILLRGASPPTSMCEPPLVCKRFSPNESLKCTDPYQSPPFIESIDSQTVSTNCASD